MEHDTFEHEYDLGALTLVRPRGHDFAMQVTPRYRHHYEAQEYERYTARLLSQVVRRHTLFVDVGAHYGFYSLLAAHHHRVVEVIALEPVPETFEVLRRNLEAAGVNNVQLHQLAASDGDGKAEFHLSVSAENCGFVPLPEAPPIRPLQVQTVRLDSLLAEHTPCDALIKIAVDGHELAVLRGMEGLFNRWPQLSLILEFNPKMLALAGAPPQALLTELERLGFAVFFLDDAHCRPYRVKPDSDLSQWLAPNGSANLYCVRKERALSVCLFSHSSHIRGAEQSLLELVKELVGDWGALCTVILPGTGPLVDALEKVGAACLSVDYGWWCVMPPGQPPPQAMQTLMSDLQRLLRDGLPVVAQIDPDVIWTQTLVIPWGAVIAGLLAKPHVWSVCEYGERDHGLRFFAPFSRITEDILASSVLVYTANQDLGDTLFPRSQPGHRRVLYRHIQVPEFGSNGVASGFFRRPGALHLGVFAALQENKGQEDAITAVGQLVAEGMDLELLLAGDIDPNYWPRLETLIAKYGLGGRVHAPGFLTGRFAAMHEADVVLVCSRREAFGRVGLEGMLMGKPVVYSTVGGLAEYMVDGRTGLAYPPGDTAALAAAIRRLAAPALRAALGSEARTYAQRRFTRQSYGGEVFARLLELRGKLPTPGRFPGLLEPLMSTAIRSLAGEARQWQLKLQELQAELTARTEELKETGELLREKESEAKKLELTLGERAAEAEGLRRELARKGPKAFAGLRKFMQKQMRSAGKRRVEARDMLTRLTVRLHWNERLRLLRRQSKLIRQYQLLDEVWYRNMYPELVTPRTDPVLHYLISGAALGCYPNPLFDTRWYLEQNPDVAAAGLNPLVHYIQAGWKEGRQPNVHFHPRLYLEANPDVATAGVEPLAHYLQAGVAERRPLQPTAMLVFSHEPEEAREWPAPDVRLLAFYLPQFHCIPENDAWWGKGFTEWTNVRRGKPQFPGHHQPHVPHSSVGYYDLTDPAVLERQVELARRFGIHGFCFHHYWFGGKRLLEMPVERLLRTGKPDFPFCLCWANENWTRRWDGLDNEVLISQEHSPEDDERFIRDVARIMRDGRYIRLEGRPLLLVYRPLLLPEPAATFRRWRQICRAKGLGDIFLAGVQGFGLSDPRPLGLDAAVEFPPNSAQLGPVSALEHGAPPEFRGQLFDYQQLQLKMQSRRDNGYTLFRGVMPSWDNTARRGEKGTVFLNSSPQEYYLWLSHMVRETRARHKLEERLVFVNAWNEWAEGCHLEPDERYGYAWLNATRRALLPAGMQPNPVAVAGAAASAQNQDSPVLVLGHDACRAGAQHVLLTLLREWHRTRPFPFRLILARDGALRAHFEALCPTLVLDPQWPAAHRQAVMKAFLPVPPRLIYANTVVNGPLLDDLSWLNCPVVTHVHELQKSIERWAPGEIMGATLRCTTHFIAVSESVAENLRLRHSVPAEKISVISPFIDTNWADGQPLSELRRQELGLVDGEIAVMGCGTTDWRKGPDLFVEIAAKACAREPRLRFLWVGGRSPDEQQGLENLVAARRLKRHVRFLGERANARGFLALGDLFLLSSREDPFPLAALEAADGGLPIVCFEGAGGMPDFVGTECGRVIPFEDIEEAARAVLELARDSQLRHRLGAQAKAKVGDRHSTVNAAFRVASVLEELAQSPPVPPLRTDSSPLVTVIVPAYNHAAFLPQRLASIQKQGVKAMEILLLDDASQDGTRALLEQFARAEPRARLLVNASNSGSTFRQWKKALAEAKGKYIWIAESDDSAEPALLTTLLGKLERNPDLALAYAQSRMLDCRGKDLGLPLGWTDDISLSRWRADYSVEGRTELQLALSIKNTIPNASAVLFRNFPGIEQLVDDSMRLCADWLFWVQLCDRGGVSYSAEPLNHWRQNSSHARTRPPGVLEWEEGRRVIETAAGLLGVTETEKQLLLEAFERKCQGWRTQTDCILAEPIAS